MEQRSPEWHDFRRQHIGSSDAAVCLNLSPWKTILDLYNEKISSDCAEISPNYAMRRGIELEPKALEIFERDTGFLMTPRVLVHPEYSWMSASIDGFELEGKCAVEIKCPGRPDHELALKGIVPDKYIPQLQHIIEVCGLDEIYYMSYMSDDAYIIFKVKRDDEYITRLIQAELEFWNRIQDRNPPKPTDRDRNEITSEEWQSYVHKWAILQKEKNELERREQDIKQKIIELADYRSAEGYGIKLTKSIRKGNLDYPKIVSDHVSKEIDLETYRKESTESWRITLNEAVNE